MARCAEVTCERELTPDGRCQFCDPTRAEAEALVSEVIAKLEAKGHDGAAQHFRAMARLVGAQEALEIIRR
jgi:hypothetical protein